MILEQLEGGKSGSPVFDLEFWCTWCGMLAHDAFQVFSSALFPHYQLVSGTGPRRIYRRLTREQAIARVTA